MKKLILFYILLAALIPLQAQSILKGKVVADEEGKEIPLAGANVFWLHIEKGTATDPEGNFSIERPTDADKLVVSFIGYKTDTIDVAKKSFIKIKLESAVDLDAIEVVSKQKTSSVSLLNPIQTVKLNEKELQKAACCNLSESFETTASVDVSYNDAVTGAKEIKMLGLDGIYTQLLSENMPYVRGLAAPYGISFMPGPWMESIYIAKGTGSVTTGYEAVTGQINVEVKEPDASERFFLNVFGDQAARIELNAHASHRFKSGLSTILLTHGSYTAIEEDHNDDTFLDMPLVKRINLMNRWKYMNDKWRGQIGIGFLKEERIAGQVGLDPDIHKGSKDLYGVFIDNTMTDFFFKLGRVLSEEKNKSIALIGNGNLYKQNATYGINPYEGDQFSVQTNILYSTNIGSGTNKQFRGGLSLIFDDVEESFKSFNLQRREIVPGIFGEYILDNGDKSGLIAGMRIDYNNEYGWFFTPKVNYRYNFNQFNVIRVSAGHAYRSANIFAENTEVLISSRSVEILEELDVEESWNAGISYTNSFKIDNREGDFTLDFYRTQFVNQVVMDLDQDPSKVLFYNLDGKSYSNSFQAELNYELMNRLNVRLAYILNDVKTSFQGELTEQPLVPKHRALFNIGYYTPFEKWMFDFTTQWTGTQRIPDTRSNPEEYQRELTSSAYFTLLAQVTKKFKNWELYIGGENLTGFMQDSPIIAANDPFGPYFDASLIWGPISGRKIYGGLRYKIPYKY